MASISLLSLHIKALLDVTPPSLSDLHLIKCSLYFTFFFLATLGHSQRLRISSVIHYAVQQSAAVH